MVDAASGTSHDSAPARRVILLGASNLTRGIATVVDTCHRHWGCPLDLVAALGHGRSYGAKSSVLGRALPGILQCGLWDDMASRPALPTAALVTDIGNDLMYESPVDQIAAWITECLDRLTAIDARIVMTRLPVANIEGLAEWKFRVLRRLMFPWGRLDFATIAARAVELDTRLAALAGQRGIPLVPLHREWYGFDPIHLKRRAWPLAWREILAGWGIAEAEWADNGRPRGRFRRWIYLQSRVPQQRWILGIGQRGRQPCGRLSEGTVLSFY